MASTILLALFAAIVLGVTLLVLGLRGRRINRNPACRSCGFDLSGIVPAGVTCPECGAGLKREGAVRDGQRRRMWVVAALGALLILLPAAAVVLTTYAVVTGADVNQYKPLGLILWEARHGGPAASQAAAKEVLRRRQRSLLTEDQALRVLETALDIQAEPDRPWCEDWGDYVEMSRTDGIATDEHYERFAKQSVVLDVSIRPRVRVGDPIPVTATIKETRVGSGSQFMVQMWIPDIEIEGEPAKPHVREIEQSLPWMAGFFNSDSEGFMISGSGAQWGPSALGVGESFGRMVRLPTDAAPGSTRVSAACVTQAELIEGNSWSWSGGEKAPESGPRVARTEFQATVQVVPPETPVVEVLPASAEMAERLATCLRPDNVWGHRSGNQEMVNMMIGIGDLPVPIAFDVFWRVGQAERKIGSITSGREAFSDGGSAWGYGEPVRSINGDLRGLSMRGADLVLKPNPALACMTTDLTSIYGGEVVIEDIEPDHVDTGEDVVSGLGGLLLRMLTGG